MNLEVSEFSSRVLGNARKLWWQRGTREPQALFVLLDGEYYVERMGAAEVIAELQQRESLRPFAVVYVSHLDGKTRWPESFCNRAFARAIAEELLPILRKQLDLAEAAPAFLGGLSLTGLAAAHVPLEFPEALAGVLCQSASFWWQEGRLTAEYARGGPPEIAYRISCGLEETAPYVEHGEGLIQRIAQLEANRAFRDMLLAAGRTVSYEEFAGGHCLSGWREDLPRAISALLKTAA